MRDIRDWKNRKVLVMGLGRFGGGVGVSRFLAGQGAEVTVTDQAEPESLRASLADLEDLPIEYHLGGHREEDFLRNEIIVVNPAVRRDSPWLRLAQEKNRVITSEMNIFFTVCPAEIIGITGSNGKSTTTAMIGHVLQKAAKVWVGGNIGRSNLLAQSGRIGADDIVVVELSSFQLYDLGRIKRSPRVAVVTNISPNHLDWHGTMEEYVRAKQNIIRFQRENDVAVLNRLDGNLTSWAGLTKGKLLWYPRQDEQRWELKVPGKHNRINAAAAYAVSRIFGLSDEDFQAAIREFTGLKHRLELVGLIDGVRYYNDSIATTPESAIAALDSFDVPRTLILGGYDKKISFSSLVEKVISSSAVVILLGQVREVLFEQISRAKQRYNTDAPACFKADSLEQAVHLARQNTRSGGVVLLSPACASYDMFLNFQERGDKFRQIVRGFGSEDEKLTDCCKI